MATAHSIESESLKIDGRPISQLKVDELKLELERRGLKKSGLKEELQERLCKYVECQAIGMGTPASVVEDESVAVAEETKQTDHTPLVEPKGITINPNSIINPAFDRDTAHRECRSQFEIISAKVEELTIEMKHIKERTARSSSEEIIIGDLRQEILRLRNENDELRERNINLSHIMSDLHTRVKDVENEKSSLITAIKLLQSDAEQIKKDKWQTINRTGRKAKNPERTPRASQDPDIEITNRFETLSVSDDDNTELDKREEVTKPRSNRVQSRKKISDEDKEAGRVLGRVNLTNKKRINASPDGLNDDVTTTTVIVGDSLVKHLEARRLKRSIKKGKQKLYVETYRGVTTDAIKHHVKPCLAKKPDRIILHVGTNDLNNKDAKQTADSIASICLDINKECPTTKVAISELIYRDDNPEYTEKVKQVNKHISKLCQQYHWDHIKHSNINNKHLNTYRLHLNKLGTSVLAKNLIEYCN